MIDVGTWEDFLLFVDRKSWAWNSLIGQEDERKLLGFLGSEVAWTSGASVDFTGVPPWVTEIIISGVGVSTNGTSNLMVQLGDAGGVEVTGYSGATAASDGATITNHSAGILLTAGGVVAAGNYSFQVRIVLEDSSDNTWTCKLSTSRNDAATAYFGAGSKATSAALDRVRITTAGGTDTGDAGVLNIRMS